MSCPTCDHTMTRLGCQYSECAGSWACPRCGTLKIGHEDGRFDVIVPALVERCRQFEEKAMPPGYLPEWVALSWASVGIAEAINPPENRP